MMRLVLMPSHLSNEAIQSRKVIWIDLYRDETDRHIHLDILVPLLPREPDGFPSGVLLFRINPYQFLYSYIQAWPTPSRTAESLLVRREGIEVLFLNELRHQKNTALSDTDRWKTDRGCESGAGG